MANKNFVDNSNITSLITKIGQNFARLKSTMTRSQYENAQNLAPGVYPIEGDENELNVISTDMISDIEVTNPSNDDVLKYNSTTQKWENGAGGSGSGGHIIQNAAGTDLAQEAKLQFGGMLKTTDDSENGVTKVSDLAEEVDWSVWNAMTEAQRTVYSAGKKIDIINVPSVSGSIPVELIKTLWTNSDPTAEFAAQTITLASDDYDFLLVTAIGANDNNDNISTIVRKGRDFTLFLSSALNNGILNVSRKFTYLSDTSYSVDVGYRRTSVDSEATTTQNIRCIPVTIYGIKSSVNVDMSALVANVSTSASKCMLSDGETSVEDALNNVITDFALGNATILDIPIKYTSNYSIMYLHMFGIYAGANTAFQSAISARKANNYSWVCSSTDTNISAEVVGDNLRITFPNPYPAGSYIVRYIGT